MSDDDQTHENGLQERRARSRRIGSKLRQIYDDVVQEDVPDDFLKILEDADKAASKTSSDT